MQYRGVPSAPHYVRLRVCIAGRINKMLPTVMLLKQRVNGWPWLVPFNINVKISPT